LEGGGGNFFGRKVKNHGFFLAHVEKNAPNVLLTIKNMVLSPGIWEKNIMYNKTYIIQKRGHECKFVGS